MAKVVQRLSKYPLLLTGILKYTAGGKENITTPTLAVGEAMVDEEIAACQLACTASKHFLQFVNDRLKRDSDHARLTELQVFRPYALGKVRVW